jgi:hypothetical protein
VAQSTIVTSTTAGSVGGGPARQSPGCNSNHFAMRAGWVGGGGGGVDDGADTADVVVIGPG